MEHIVLALNDLPVAVRTIGFISLITLLFFFLFQILPRRNLFLKIGPLEFNLGNKTFEKQSPHKTCGNAKDIVIMLSDIAKLSYKKFILEHVEIIRIQMDCVDQYSQQIQAIMQSGYIALLGKKKDGKITNIIKSHSYSSYRILLHFIRRELVDNIRADVKELNFSVMDDMVFKTYVKNKVDELLSSATDLLNELYYYTDDISREELYRYNYDNLSNKVKDILEEGFYTLRRLSTEKNRESISLNNEMESVINKYL
jgi:hypothetical protein